MQVHAADLSGREAIDLCDPGCEVAQLLASHMSGLKSMAEEEAIKGLDEEPQSNPTSEGHGTDRNKNVGRRFEAPEGVLLRAEISYAPAEVWCPHEHIVKLSFADVREEFTHK